MIKNLSFHVVRCDHLGCRDKGACHSVLRKLLQGELLVGLWVGMESPCYSRFKVCWCSMVYYYGYTAQQFFESSDKTPLNSILWVLYGRLNIWPSVLFTIPASFFGYGPIIFASVL